MKTIHFYIFCIFLLLALDIQAQQQNTIQVRPIVMTQPLDADVTTLAENLTKNTEIQITNSSSCQIRVERIDGSLERLGGGVKIATKGRIPLRDFKDIANFQGGLTRITASEFSGTFSQNDFDIQGVSVNKNGEFQIPAGTYRFCITLYGSSSDPIRCPIDPNLPLNNITQSCAIVQVVSYRPPVLLNVNAGMGITNHNGILVLPPNPNNQPNLSTPLTFNWTPATGGPLQDIVYDLFIIEIPPNDTNDPNQAYQALINRASATTALSDFPFFVKLENFTGTSTQLLPQDLPAEGFGLGQRYVVGIRAKHRDNRPLNIENNGFSQIFVFQCGIAPAAPVNLLTLETFPQDGVYMPFRYMPMVVKYAPYSNDYRKFVSNFSISNSGGTVYAKRRPLSWLDGPKRIPNASTITNFTDDRAQHIIVSAETDENNYNRHIFTNRGDTYRWTADVEIEVQGQSVPLQNSVSASFIAGMAPSTLLLPAANARVSATNGKIKFKFKTSEPPATPLFPGYDLLQIRGRDRSVNFHNVLIDERCVLEIAKDAQFTDVARVIFKDYRLRKEFILDEWPNALTEVYKEIEDSLAITQPGTYYWRVKWMVTPQNPLPSDFDTPHANSYSVSEVRTFTIGEGAVPATPIAQTPTPPANDCNGVCNLTPQGDRESLPITANQTISIGAFQLQVSGTPTGSTASGYAGSGQIINFRDENTQNTWPARVEVDFTNLKINSLGIAHHGEAKSKGGDTQSTVLQLLQATGQALGVGQGGALKTPFGWQETIDNVKVALLIDSIKFTPQKAAATVKIGYDINKDIFAGHPLMFQVSDICLKRGGFGDAFKLGLAQDLVIGDTTNEDNYAVYLFGNTSGRSEQEKTVVSWTCQGFEYLQVGGKVVFPRKVLIPENENGVRSTTASEVVEGFFNAKLQRSQEGSFGFISTVDFKDKAFQFTSLPGFGVKIQSAVFDLSEAANDPAMQFPEGYSSPEPRLLDAWTGFYLKEMSFRLPNEFRNAAGQRMEAGIKNVLIDNQGVSGKIYWNHLVNTGGVPDSGKVNILYFTLDEITATFLKNTLTEGRMTGKIGIPIFENNREQYLAFNAILGQNTTNESGQPRQTNGYNFTLTVSPPADKTLKIPMWDIASIKIAPTSFVKLQLGEKDGAAFSLTGEVGFSGSVGGFPAAINIPGLSVENLAFSTIEGDASKDKLTGALKVGDRVVWGQVPNESNNPPEIPTGPANTSPPRSGPNYADDNWAEPAAPTALARIDIGGFALQINTINVEGAETIVSNTATPGNLKLKIDFGFKLADALSVDNVDLTFASTVRLDIEGSDLTFAFHEVKGPEQIRLRGEIAGLGLEGCVQFKQSGIAGGIKATIPMLGVVAVAAEFGNAPNADGTRYEYFNIQALFRSETGITLFAGVNLYGLSGGVWHHMARSSNIQPVPALGDAARSDTTVNCGDLVAGADVRFTPDPNVVFGLSFKAFFGCTGNSTTYNFDVGLTAEVQKNVGLSLIQIEGNLYVMKEMGTVTNQNAAVNVYAKVAFEWQKQANGDEIINVAFDLSVLLKAGDLKLIYGNQRGDEHIAAQARFHSTKYANGAPGIWFFKMGDPANPQKSGLEINLLDIVKINVNTYLYTGVHPTEIPTNLPPFPAEITELIGQGGNTDRIPNSAQRSGTTALSNPTAGFGFGINFSATIEPTFLIFYAKLQLILGMDAMIREYPGGYCGNQSGTEWYAQAQAYAGIKGEFGVKVELPFISGKFPIISLGAGIAMRAGLPRPAYFTGLAGLNYSILGGMVSGRMNFKIDIGEKCPDANPLQGMKFIGDLSPEKGSRDVSIYTRVGAAFNYPMNRWMELIDDNGNTRQFKPVFNFLQVKKDSEVVGSAYGENSLSLDGLSVQFKPTRALEINTDYNLLCQITFKEHSGGQDVTFKVNGKDYVEEATATFKTQAIPPNRIAEENISYTWPAQNQRFYIPGSISPVPALGGGASGRIQLQQAENANVFRAGRSRTITGTSNRAFSYYVRVVSPSSRVYQEDITSQVVGQSPLFISYQMPPNLQPETVYNVQIVQKGRETAMQRYEIVGRSEQVTLKQDNIIERRINQIKLPTEDIADDELLIYNYYFRTSKFATPAQKLQQATLRNFTALGDLSVGELYLDEALDTYDVNGVAVKQGNGAINYYPIVGIELAGTDALSQNEYGYTNAILRNLSQSIVATDYFNASVGNNSRSTFTENFMSTVIDASRKYNEEVTIVRYGNYGTRTSSVARSIGVIDRGNSHTLKYTFDFPLSTTTLSSFRIGSSFDPIQNPLSMSEIRAAFGDNSQLVLENIISQAATVSVSNMLTPRPAANATAPANNVVTSIPQPQTTTTTTPTANSSSSVATVRNTNVSFNPNATFRYAPLPAIKYGVVFNGFMAFRQRVYGVHDRLDDFLRFVEVGRTASSINFTESTPGIFTKVNNYLGRQAVQINGVGATSSHPLNGSAPALDLFGTRRQATIKYGSIMASPAHSKQVLFDIRNR